MSAGYEPLETHNEMSNDARRLVQDQLDMQVADVHAMLRLPIEDDSGLRHGCNHAAAQVLLSVISGVSVSLFDRSAMRRRGNRGRLFKKLLVRHYPWDQELDVPGRRRGRNAADDLYKLFRNPLAHSLGVVDPNAYSGGRLLAVNKFLMQESEICDLEMATTREERWLEPTLVLSGQTLTLRVRSLYWGVREMVERVSRTTDARSFSFPERDAETT